MCLECQEPIKGRIDKKFCSDYCRNTYNNSVAKDSKNLIRNINNRLKRNYKILSELNVSGKTKSSRAKLYDKGFDFQLFTSIYQTKTGNTYFYVYDEGYLALENDVKKLKRKFKKLDSKLAITKYSLLPSKLLLKHLFDSIVLKECRIHQQQETVFFAKIKT